MKKWMLLHLLLVIIVSVHGQDNLNNTKITGYKGIWFTLGQISSQYGDKYSGGLGTYTAKHRPLAIYAPEVDKTFFVYGGTTGAREKHLLCMISYYNHKTNQVPQPTVVFDKQGVDDPHDNPSLLIDQDGYLWVFVSGRGRHRPGYKYRSKTPYDIETFEQISEEEMTYPQPLYHEENGFFNFFTKYTGVRELYYETSADGVNWSDDIKLAGIIEAGATKSGHYQVSSIHENTVCTFFSRHPNGNVDRRTDLYYVQSNDFGKTWTNIHGDTLTLPLTRVENSARVADYTTTNKNVYLKDLNFDRSGNPICLYLISNGHQPGPGEGPREWRITRYDGKKWVTTTLFNSDHNYDMGSLYTDKNKWRVIAPAVTGPQRHHSGGEMILWESNDQGRSWEAVNQFTTESQMNHNYARRPRKAKDPFYCFWANGDPSDFTESRLYFGSSEGDVYQLPYEMTLDYQNPISIK